MYFDQDELSKLIEESEDTHSDAMRTSGPLFDEFVDVGLEQRAHGEIDPEEGREFAAAQSDALRHGLVGVGATAGTYQYYCAIHNFMTGSVTVKT